MHELQPNPFGLHLIVVKPSAEVDEPKRGIVLFSLASYVQSKKSRSAEEMKLNELIALFLPTRDLQPMCFMFSACMYIAVTSVERELKSVYNLGAPVILVKRLFTQDRKSVV